MADDNREPLLRRIARRVLGDEVAKSIWTRIDIIGDIAVLRVPFGFKPETLKPIAEELLRELKYVKSVWAISSPVEGVYRLRRYIHLAGEKRTVTLYREHGCSFLVDISRVYISPRLSYEHLRIAKQVREGELVINMYAGAGLFSIIISKASKPSKVYSIDINPDAYTFMCYNIKANKVESIVVPLLGDAAHIIECHLTRIADRVLMPLPELALQHLGHAIRALKPSGGIVHVYLHVTAKKPKEAIEKAKDITVHELYKYTPWFKIRYARVVRSVGPSYYQVVLDLDIAP